MKLLKKQGLIVILLGLLVTALTLGIILMLPAKTASADVDVFVAEKEFTVTTEDDLKAKIQEAGEAATKIILANNIEMKSTIKKEGMQYFPLVIEANQNIQIDLAGHILSTAVLAVDHSTIANYGTLSVIDSSNEYKGAVVSNGYVGSGFTFWNPTNVITNFGDLTINANLRVDCPESAAEGEVGHYESAYTRDVHLVQNEFLLPVSSGDQTIHGVSLTINGGTFDLNNGAGALYNFFYLRDANLTINGGKFINTYPNRPSGNDGFLAYMISLESAGELEDQIRPYLETKITITNGDFSDENILSKSPSLLYDWFYRPKIEGESYTVLITGGDFPMDLSAYVPEGYWMELFEEKTEQGERVDRFYRTGPEDPSKAAASVSVDGGKEHYFFTFDSAFQDAEPKQGEKIRTLKLYQDAEVEQLMIGPYSSNTSGVLKIDLNGHKLKIEPSTSKLHIRLRGNLTICDSSTDQNGELILSVKSGNKVDGYANFIYIDKSNISFVLESGTLLQTGYLPKDPSTLASTVQASSYYAQSLFKISSKISDENVSNNLGLITIKGGNIISDVKFGTENEVTGTGHANLVSWYYGSNMTKDNEFGFEEGHISLENKKKVFVFDLDDYLADSTRACKLSWDVGNVVTDKGLTCTESSDGYIVSKAKDKMNFIIGSGEQFESLSNAVKQALPSSTITALRDNIEVNESVEIGNGITLNLNTVAQFNIILGTENVLTLTGGASICNGSLQGNLTVTGEATLEGLTLNGNITVNSGTLTILSGIYETEFTIEEGASLAISGGSFKGSQITRLDEFFDKNLGAFDEENKFDYEGNPDKLFNVQFGPNRKAQAWYNKFSDNEYTIGSTDDWLSFSLFVNGGIDSFKGKTVKLTENLDFDPNAASGAALAAEVAEPNFMPAGNAKNKFAGVFDGNNFMMKNIVAEEQFVGLFGFCTGDARFRNITIKDSTFTIANGNLDQFNSVNGYRAAGALIGEGFMGGNAAGTDWSGNITLNNVKVGYELSIYNFNGGIIGHSWGNVYIDGLKIQNATTITSNWKMGGIVGYLEGNFYLKKADIEQGNGAEKPNGLILEDENTYTPAGALVGHANGPTNTIEDCTILEHNDSLIGTTYAQGVDSTITVKGAETNLDIYAIVGNGRSALGETRVELSQKSDENGTSRSSVKVQTANDYATFYEVQEDGIETKLDVKFDSENGLTATAKLNVTIGGITETSFTYSGTLPESVTFETFVLYDELGRALSNEEYAYLGTFTVTATLRTSDYGVGEKVLLVTSYTVSGEGAKNYNFGPTGNQAFITITVNPTTLTVRVNSNGEVEYEGFVGGEDESVLGGTLTLEKVDNGDGTYTVTPSGLESENYNIVYASGIVSAPAGTNNVTPDYTLWIILGTLAAVALVCGTVAIVLIRRKRD